MRRTFIFAFLLVAASAVSAAGPAGQPAQAHRKTPASVHAGSRPAKGQTASHKGSRKTSRHPGQSAKFHRQGGATVHKSRYTPERTPESAAGGISSSSSYADGYRNGFEAGRAAVLQQPGNGGVDARFAGQSSEATQVREQSAPAREPSVARRPAENETSHAPAQGETTETETPETPPLDEVASLHLGGAGMTGSLRGSLASLERQNERTDAEGLERIEDDADLSNRIAHKLLVPLPASAALNVNPVLPEHNRYCRPWTARFLADLARAHEAAFHRPIQVNSAVRTVDYQKRLMRTNGNAAAAEGDIVSPHLTGATVDIGKSGLSGKEIAWMRRQLLGLQQAGKIDVEEEFEQACFHITVYKSYALSKPVRPTGQPETSQGSATRHKAGQRVEKPVSQPPAEIPAGELPVQGL